MDARITEGELTFDFKDVVNAVKLDDKEHPCRRHYCGTADIIIERNDDLLIIEIKDPNASGTPDESCNKLLDKITAEKIYNKLVFSVAFLAVEEELDIRKKRDFILLFSGSIDDAMMQTLTDKYMNKLVHRGCDQGQKICHKFSVMNEISWSKYFPDYLITRNIS